MIFRFSLIDYSGVLGDVNDYEQFHGEELFQIPARVRGTRRSERQVLSLLRFKTFFELQSELLLISAGVVDDGASRRCQRSCIVPRSCFGVTQ